MKKLLLAVCVLVFAISLPSCTEEILSPDTQSSTTLETDDEEDESKPPI